MAETSGQAKSAALEKRTCFDKFFGCLKRDNPDVSAKSKSKYEDPDQVDQTSGKLISKEAPPASQAYTGMKPTPENVFSPEFTQKLKQSEQRRRGNIQGGASIFSQTPTLDISKAFPLPEPVKSSNLQAPVIVQAVSEFVSPYSYIPDNEGQRIAPMSTDTAGRYGILPADDPVPSPSQQQWAQIKQTPLLQRRLWKEFQDKVAVSGHSGEQTGKNEYGASFKYYLQNPRPRTGLSDNETLAKAAQNADPRYLYCEDDGRLYYGVFYIFSQPSLEYMAFRTDTVTMIYYENGDEYIGTVESGKTRNSPFRRKIGTLKIAATGQSLGEREWDNLDKMIGA